MPIMCDYVDTSRPTVSWDNSPYYLVRAGTSWISFAIQNSETIRFSGTLSTMATELADCLDKLEKSELFQLHWWSRTGKILFTSDPSGITLREVGTGRLIGVNKTLLYDLHSWLAAVTGAGCSADDDLEKLRASRSRLGLILSLQDRRSGQTFPVEISQIGQIQQELLRLASDCSMTNYSQIELVNHVPGNSLIFTRLDELRYGLLLKSPAGSLQLSQISRPTLVWLAQEIGRCASEAAL